MESNLLLLAITHAVTLVRPFDGGGWSEIIRQPKVYDFGTRFVSFACGCYPLRPEDFGALWQHQEPAHLQASFPDTPNRYWREGQGREVDFIVVHRGYVTLVPRIHQLRPAENLAR